MSKIEENIQITAENNLSKLDIPSVLPVVPLRDIVIFPYMMYPVLAGRESTVKAINTSLENEKYVMLVTQMDSKIEDPEPENLYKNGTIARIIQVIKLPNNLIKVLIDGIVQGEVINFRQNQYLEAEVVYKFPRID